jgi:predicted nucleotidyltransferase
MNTRYYYFKQTDVIITIMQNYYADILTKLYDARVKFILAGGVASVLHGVERLTLDIDIAVEMSEENLGRFSNVLQEINLIPRLPVGIDFLRDPERIKDAVDNKNALVFTLYDPLMPIKQVDVFLSKENSYEELINHTDNVDINGREILIVSIPKLIQMKRIAGRDKDLRDIIELENLLEES